MVATTPDTFSRASSFQISSGFSWESAGTHSHVTVTRLPHPLTLKHVDGGLGVVPHGVHEDKGEEFGEGNAHLGPHQFVCDHLGHERGCLLAHGRALGVAKQVQQVDQGTCGDRTETLLLQVELQVKGQSDHTLWIIKITIMNFITWITPHTHDTPCKLL